MIIHYFKKPLQACKRCGSFVMHSAIVEKMRDKAYDCLTAVWTEVKEP